MNPDFELNLEDCLARLRSGSKIEECLSCYPDQAESLRPLLSAAVDVHSLPAPEPCLDSVETGRQRMFASLEEQDWVRNSVEAPISKDSLSRYTERTGKFLRFILIGKESKGMKLALRLALNFAVILAVAGLLTVNASAGALPGDPLYGVKRAWEEVHLALTIKDQDRQQLQTQLEAERRTEIEKLLQLHRERIVEFDGILEQISANQCVISGIQFKMTSQTIIEGNPVIGHKVKLRASIESDNQLIALRLHIENTDLPGSRPAAQSSRTPWPTDDHGSITSTPTVNPSILPRYLDDTDDDMDDGSDDDVDDDSDDDVDDGSDDDVDDGSDDDVDDDGEDDVDDDGEDDVDDDGDGSGDDSSDDD